MEQDDAPTGEDVDLAFDHQIPSAREAVRFDALLGERIRYLRKQHALSLKALADASGISIGSLSQIERGLSSPSVRVLSGIAQSLEVSLGSLFEDAGAPASAEADIVVRSTMRKKLAFWRTGMAKELLTPQTDMRGLDMFMIVIEPGGTTGATAYSHDGLDAGFVLEGQVAISIDGQEYILDPGDSFGFSSDRPHSFRNPTSQRARVIWINAHPPMRRE